MEKSMTRDGEIGRKKSWTKPVMRKLNLTDDQMETLFGEHVVTPRRKRQAAG
jgi:hypothetical protein